MLTDTDLKLMLEAINQTDNIDTYISEESNGGFSNMNNSEVTPTWLFGYGSLIYKVDFPYLRSEQASITGWQRRFWQGSHDHRGTPEQPGRVVTLVPAAKVVCKGIAYLVENNVFDHLDHREKNGYQRLEVDIALLNGQQKVSGVLYVADEHNSAYLGAASTRDIAAHIAGAHGPSGSNRDYVLQLAEALRDLGDMDPHVFKLESLLRSNNTRQTETSSV